jgi:hypothetical protein
LNPPISPDTVIVTAPCPTCPVVVCQIINDVDTTGGTATYTSCGVPTGYTASTADANGCVTYTPIAGSGQVLPVSTCQIVCNNGLCDTMIVVLNPPISPDTVFVTAPCPTCPVVVCQMSSDVDTTGGTATYTNCGVPTGYTTSTADANGCVTYTPIAGSGQVLPVSTCQIVCNNGLCDTMIVVLNPPISPDTVIVTAPCPACPVVVCQIINDVDTTGGTATYTSCGIPAGYTASTADANGCVTYTPIAGSGQTLPVSTCQIVCNNGLCDTVIVVLNPPISPDTVIVTAPCPTCPIVVCQIINDVDTTGGTETYASCGVPSGYTASTADANGCVTYTPIAGSGQTLPVSTCQIVCNNGLCDTMIVVLNPPISSDTIFITAPCPSCPVVVCQMSDHVDTTGGTATYTNCGVPVGYTVSAVDSNGCVTYTPIAGSGQVTPVSTCQVVCNNGLCDTVIIVLYPPIRPDTVIVTSPCPTCPVTACVVINDVTNAGGTATYTNCGAPAGYTISPSDSPACFTFTPIAGSGQTMPASSCIVICNNGLCDTTVVMLNPPIPCAITAVYADTLCNDQGTPADPSDDTFTFLVTVNAISGSSGMWKANDPLNTTGFYGVPKSFGPYPIANGPLSVTITDFFSSGCTFQLPLLVPPQACSVVPCPITPGVICLPITVTRN